MDLKARGKNRGDELEASQKALDSALQVQDSFREELVRTVSLLNRILTLSLRLLMLASSQEQATVSFSSTFAAVESACATPAGRFKFDAYAYQAKQVADTTCKRKSDIVKLLDASLNLAKDMEQQYVCDVLSFMALRNLDLSLTWIPWPLCRSITDEDVSALAAEIVLEDARNCDQKS